ncbi:MAG TPA: hypothetical protein H9852_05615 [Candidatus Mediterraneibacter colneyensis]|nr:hypothetical protein [Candidatus Mediterraneibacter colneyensis]
MRKRNWKSCVCEMLYCRPALNRQILCIRRSMAEVCKILNSGCCHGHEM